MQLGTRRWSDPCSTSERRDRAGMCGGGVRRWRRDSCARQAGPGRSSYVAGRVALARCSAVRFSSAPRSCWEWSRCRRDGTFSLGSHLSSAALRAAARADRRYTVGLLSRPPYCLTGGPSYREGCNHIHDAMAVSMATPCQEEQMTKYTPARAALRLLGARAALLGRAARAASRQAPRRVREAAPTPRSRSSPRRARRSDFAAINQLQKDLAFHLSGHVLHSLLWKNMAAEGRRRAGRRAGGGDQGVLRLLRGLQGTAQPRPPQHPGLGLGHARLGAARPSGWWSSRSTITRATSATARCRSWCSTCGSTPTTCSTGT